MSLEIVGVTCPSLVALETGTCLVLVEAQQPSPQALVGAAGESARTAGKAPSVHYASHPSAGVGRISNGVHAPAGLSSLLRSWIRGSRLKGDRGLHSFASDFFGGR